MIRIGSVAAYRDARRLGVYFRLNGVATRLEQQADGWSISVCDADHAALAGRELAVYLHDPDDPRFPSVSMPEHILGRIGPRDRRIIEMHNRGHTPGVIATSSGASERRVQRVVEWFQERVAREYGGWAHADSGAGGGEGQTPVSPPASSPAP